MHRIVMLCLVFLLTSVVGFGCWGRKSDGPEGSRRQAEVLGKLGVSQSGKMPDFVTLAKRLQPVVVNVSTTQTTRGRELGIPPQQEEGGPTEQFSEKYFGLVKPFVNFSRLLTGQNYFSLSKSPDFDDDEYIVCLYLCYVV